MNSLIPSGPLLRPLNERHFPAADSGADVRLVGGGEVGPGSEGIHKATSAHDGTWSGMLNFLVFSKALTNARV